MITNPIFEAAIAKANAEQRVAIETTEGPVLVLAGPGTGKTQILSLRIGKILQIPDIFPHNILCLTYTDAGAVAMRKRLSEFIGAEAYKVHIYTFHSFCNTIIQDNRQYFGDSQDLQPISELETIDVYYDLINNLPAGNRFKKYTGNIYSAYIALKKLFETIKKENYVPEDLIYQAEKYIKSLPDNPEYLYKTNGKNHKKGDVKSHLVLEETKKIEKFIDAVLLFPVFQQKMKKAERYDFNDMIHWVINAFETHENLLARYQEQFQYILVDEFQDTNGSQNKILSLLASFWEDNPNLFVVGDDDQSIYSFQGAENERIKQFVAQYNENLKAIVLTQNYRSTQAILDASKASIEHNKSRLVLDTNLIDNFEKQGQKLAKNLVSKKQIQTNEIEIRAYNNAFHEAADIAFEIENKKNNGEDLNEIAILYRNKKDVEKIIKVFDQKQIPYNIRKRLNILKTPFIKKLTAILSYIDAENQAFESGNFIISKALFFDFFTINTHDISKIALYIAANKLKWRTFLVNESEMKKLSISSEKEILALSFAIENGIKNVHNHTLQVVFEKLLTDLKLINYILKSPEKILLLQTLTSFFDFLKEESVKNPEITLTQFLSMISKMNENGVELAIEQIVSQEAGVHFITAHSSKGLEFKTVYLINCESKSWEKKSSKGEQIKFPPIDEFDISKKDIEEERRLFYVAMTRAKEQLFLSYPVMKTSDKDIKEGTLEKSQFIQELIDKAGILPISKAIKNLEMAEFLMLLLAESPKPAIEAYEKSHINQVLRNYKLSVTHLSKYLSCPLTFYFENILKIPTARTADAAFGNAYHYAIDQFFKAMLADWNKQFPSLERFEYFFNLGLTRYASHFTEEEYLLKKEYAEQILPLYYENYINTWEKNVETEYDFSIVLLDEVPITGKIDKIEKRGNEVNVIDYKTGKPENAKKKLIRPNAEADETSTFEKLHGGDYWRQIVFYKLLIDNNKTQDWHMVSGEIDLLQPDKDNNFVKHKIVVTPEDEEIVKNQIKDTYIKIMNHDFYTGCNDEKCHWCSSFL